MNQLIDQLPMNQLIAQWWSKRLLGIIRRRIESKQTSKKKNKIKGMLPYKFMVHLHPEYYSVTSSTLIYSTQDGELQVAQKE